jgi:hypothetical protein
LKRAGGRGDWRREVKVGSQVTILVQVPSRAFRIIRSLADSEHMTPEGFIERRLSDLLREWEAREAEEEEENDEAQPRPADQPVGYL